MKSRVEFKSAAFPKYPDEGNELINEHCWGKRLAEFIRDTLPSYGAPTGEIICEDWGWMVDLKHDAFPLWVGCGVMDEPGESLEDEGDADESPAPHLPVQSSLTEFAMFVTAEPGFLQKLFKKVDPQPAIATVVTALERMIADHPSKFLEPSWD